MEKLLRQLEDFSNMTFESSWAREYGCAVGGLFNDVDDLVKERFKEMALAMTQRMESEMDEHKANLEGSFALACDEHAQYHLGFAHGIAYALEVLDITAD